MRMMRRAGLLALIDVPSLSELLTDATLLTFKGQGTSSITSMSVSLSGIDTTVPFYIIYSKGNLEFQKYKDGEVTSLLNTGSYTWLPTVSSSSLSYSSNNGFGHAAALVRFPSFTEEQIDAGLRKVNATSKAYKLSSTREYVTFNTSEINANAIYFASFGYSEDLGGLSFTYGSDIGSDPIFAIDSDGNNVYSYLNDYSTTTYVVRRGDTKSSLYMGCVCELT